jgi:RNA polymerase sigma-70 factor (ECF subfamily)
VTELDLVGRARHGDLDAFTALAGARLATMTRTATAILGDETEAHDAVQEALISIWRELPTLREPDRFDAWAGRILVNACRHALRRRIRSRVREIRLSPEPADGPGFDDHGGGGGGGGGGAGGGGGGGVAAGGIAVVGARAESIGNDDALNRAFERLDADQRALLVMHHLEDRPITEIAAIFGIPTGTVKSRLFAARRALQDALDREWR